MQSPTVISFAMLLKKLHLMQHHIADYQFAPNCSANKIVCLSKYKPFATYDLFFMQWTIGNIQ